MIWLNLGAGYTWLGYTPQNCLEINAALASVNPPPAEDDRLIGQTKFATYYQGQWTGSLTHLCPGESYVMDLSSASTLQYPEAGQKDLLATRPLATDPDREKYNVASHQQYTMTLLGQLIDHDGQVSLNENDLVLALSGQEVRGLARPMAGQNGMIFLSTGSNLAAGELIRFVAWSDALQQYVEIRETISFEALRGLGTLESPFLFTMAGAVGTELPTAQAWTIGDPYPNPTHGTVSIPYYISQPASVSLYLLNSLGHVVHKQEISLETPGKHKLELKKGALPRGVYFYKVLLSGAHNSILKTGTLVVID